MDNYFIDNNSEELNQSDQQIFDDITEKFVPRRKAILNDEKLRLTMKLVSASTMEGR